MSKSKTDKTPSPDRGQFTSSIGFILAAAGSAVGLGNLWKFPYIAGNSGGGYFLIIYLVFILLLGVPIIIAEMAIGRKTQLNAIGAYKKLDKKWTFVGGLGVLCAFIILSYYSVVGGWVLKYIVGYLTGGNFGANTGAYFNTFITSPVEPIAWHLLFMVICIGIVLGGVVKGIEKASKIMLPALFIFIVIVAIRSVTLDGAMEGLKFFFVPNFEAINTFPKFANVLVAALGQVFFSLSLGMGITITYGSYLKKDIDMPKNALMIGGLDTLVAVLAGVAILPAVFALGFEPTAGPGLIFATLPAVFESMPFGNVFGFIFFILVFVAAATSAIALLEVVAAYFIDNFKWSRRKATILMGTLMAVVGVFASLSFGALDGILIGGMNLFDALGYLTDKILMPLSALFMCIFVGYVWGMPKICEEVSIGCKNFNWQKLFGVVIRYIAPALILVIFIMGLIPAK